MNLADCYRLLGLRSDASFQEIKASYRRLARRYHPDANPNDRQAHDKFIQLTGAYKILIDAVPPNRAEQSSPDPLNETAPQGQSPPRNGRTSTIKEGIASPGDQCDEEAVPVVQFNPQLSEIEQELKQSTYEQLRYLLKEQRFPRAIALVEGLAQRISQDPEVRQWQAIAYQRWGRYLVNHQQLDKARVYLKKALRTDPHNRSLSLEVEQDFRRMEQRL